MRCENCGRGKVVPAVAGKVPMCGTCRMASAASQQLAPKKLVTVDVDAASQLTRRFAVHVVPTLIVLHRAK
jgi:thioredoxin-like negative regulator of GroEL